MAGYRTCGSASLDSTTAYGPTGSPASCRNRFSAMRSWATATAAGAGATNVRRAKYSSAAAGGFSNSVVTTSHRSASRASASSSS